VEILDANASLNSKLLMATGDIPHTKEEKFNEEKQSGRKEKMRIKLC